MLKPNLSKRRFGIDLLSLPRSVARDPEVLASIRQLADALLEADPSAELTLVASKSLAPELEPHFRRPNAAAYFLPVPEFLPLQTYTQQTLLPVLFRVRNVNQVISFGTGVPTLYPAPKVLSLLPGQIREWWKLVPALLAADAVTVDTLAQKMTLESRLPGLKSKVEAITPAVSADYHPYPKDAGREVLERYGIKGRYFLFLGTVEASSPCYVALDAFAKIAHRPRLKSVNLVLAGPRGMSVGSVRKRIDELGLNHRVILTGELPPRELPLWLSNAQFAICPDAGDDAPLTLLRALAAGCPVVVPSFRVFDAKFKPAILQCHESDPKSLAEAMTKIMADIELRDNLVKEGLDLLNEQTWGKRADAFLNIFDNSKQSYRLLGAKLNLV